MDEIIRTRRPCAPGVLLKAGYLQPNKISVTALAEALGISRKQVSLVLNGHARVTPHLAGRLAKVLGTSTQLWLNLQAKVDAYDAEQEAKDWQPSRTLLPAA